MCFGFFILGSGKGPNLVCWHPRRWAGQGKTTKQSIFGPEDDLRHEHDVGPRDSASKTRLEMHKSGGNPALGPRFAF